MQHEHGEIPPPERQPFFGPGAPYFVTWFLLAILISLLGTNVKGYYQERDACLAIPSNQTALPRQ